MGFRTLAIEQRSSEVWQLLSAVKAEFGKFAGVLEKAHGQLDTVQNSIKAAGVRTRALERQPKGADTLPGADPPQLPDPDGEQPPPLRFCRSGQALSHMPARRRPGTTDTASCGDRRCQHV